MKDMKPELKKLMARAKEVQGQVKNLMKDRAWMDQARKYAERQGTEMKKILGGDVEKIKTFIEKEKAELEKLQKSIPGEVKKLKGFVDAQKKELGVLLNSVKKTAANKAEREKAVAKAKTTAKTAADKAKKEATAAARKAQAKVSEKVGQVRSAKGGSKKKGASASASSSTSTDAQA